MSDKRITILLVDDDPEIAQAVLNFLDPERYRIEVVDDGGLVLGAVAHIRPDVILLDVHLPSLSGLDLLREIKTRRPALPVIIVSGYVSTGNAIAAMKDGAFEYLTKPFRFAALEDAIVRACGRQAGSTPCSDEDVIPSDGQLIGKSPEIVAVAKMVGQIADIQAPVLLMGESGTGKELVARAIHRNSRRCTKPFMVVSCAASTEEHLEAELFGSTDQGQSARHSQGPGKLVEAGDGTVFLDEVADLPPLIQSRLFRMLEDGTIEAPDGQGAVAVGARLVAASSQSLVDLMREGRFRVDLFYKLKVISFYLPRLRERRSDIALLSEYFIRKYSREVRRPSKPLSKEALELLSTYPWPGNVRELENAIHTAVVLSRESELTATDFPMLDDPLRLPIAAYPEQTTYYDLFRQALSRVFDQAATQSGGRIYAEMTAALDQALVEAALECTHRNQVQAAQLLGISRNTLRERMKRFAMIPA